MDFTRQLIPVNMGNDQFRVIVIPLIISFFYFLFTFLQTFIKERDDDNAIGWIYSIRGFGRYYSLGSIAYIDFFIMVGLAIWISIKTINLNGNLGNVGISSIIFGTAYFIMNIGFFLYFIYENHKVVPSIAVTDFIREEIEYIIGTLIYQVVSFVFFSIIVAGIYFEITNFKHNDTELYPKA